MAERPTMADILLGRRLNLSGGLPSADLSRAERREVDRDLAGPPPVWDALMPQSEEERQARHWRNSLLPWMAWTLPPVNAYLGGYRLAEGVVEGRPLHALMGAGQIGGSVVWPAPGVTNLPASVTNRLPPFLGGTRTPPSAPPSRWEPRGLPSGATPEARALYADLSRHYATTGDAEAMRLLQRMEGGPTHGTRDLYALAPMGRESRHTEHLGASHLDLWGPQFGSPRVNPNIAAESGRARVNPNLASETARTEFHALQPVAAFPRIAGTSAVDARNAQLALRQANGNYDDAIAFLNGNHPGAESLLRTWQARGVDAGQALRYWQGLAGLRDLERPSRLNALIPPAFLGAGAAPDTNPPLE